MPQFTYSARDAGGSLVRGKIEAGSRKEAIRLIGMQKLRPVSVKEPSSGASNGNGSAHRGFFASLKKKDTESAPAEQAPTRGKIAGLSRRHRLPFLRALGELSASGMPVGDAVRLLSVRLKDQNLKLLARNIWERVSGGKSISEAMAEIPGVFDRSTVYLVESGEATGNLNEILSRLVTHFEDQKELRSKVTAAMAYPLLLLVVAVGVVLFSVFVLLPRLESMLSGLGGQLPVSTQLLISGSEFLISYGLFIAAAVVVMALGWWQWQRTEQGGLTWDAFFLRVPVIGKFRLSADVLQISQTMSVLLENGVTTVETLKMTENVITNRALRAGFGEARQKVVEGKSISGSLASTGFFPQTVLDMLAVGEDTGNIIYSLKQIVKIYQRDLSRQLQAFIGVLSIGVLIGVFAFVGFIAYAIIAAVFQLSASFSM